MQDSWWVFDFLNRVNIEIRGTEQISNIGSENFAWPTRQLLHAELDKCPRRDRTNVHHWTWNFSLPDPTNVICGTDKSPWPAPTNVPDQPRQMSPTSPDKCPWSDPTNVPDQPRLMFQTSPDKCPPISEKPCSHFPQFGYLVSFEVGRLLTSPLKSKRFPKLNCDPYQLRFLHHPPSNHRPHIPRSTHRNWS